MSFLRPFTFALLTLLAFANQGFSVPDITSVAPTFGTPGTTITITGTDLTGATVHFGSKTTAPITNTDTEITVNVPQLTPGIVPLLVTTSSGASFPPILFTVQGSWTAIVTNTTNPPLGSLSAITIPATGFPIFSTPITDSGATINSPFGIAITPDGRTALAVNGNGNSVSIVDIASNSVTGSIIVGTSPRFVAINSDGSVAYVTNALDGTVTPIDLTVNPPSPQPPFPSDTGSPTPTGIAISFDNNNLYVVNETTNTLTPFDLTTDPFNPTMGTSVAIPTTSGNEFFHIALTPASAKIQKAFVSVRDSSNPNSTVYSFTLGDQPQTPAAAVAILTNRSNPAGMAVSQDGTTLYVADFDPVSGRAVSIIDVQHDAWVKDIIFPVNVGLNNVALTPDGKQLYATDVMNGGVFPVDLTTVPPVIQGLVTTGKIPFAIAVTPDQAPLARFTADEVAFGSATSFDATLSVSPVGSIASYLWDFGDGTPPTTTTSPFITHTYGAPGTYLASLTVTNTAGTSTTKVFPTGQTVSNSGDISAFICRTIIVLAPPPTVSSMNPTQGPVTGGTPVTITGTNLNCVEEVFFGSNLGGITSIAPDGTSLTVLSPAALLPGAVTVTVLTCNGSAVAGLFTYLPLPAITGLSPTSGPVSGGTSVTITGTNLSCIQDVRFGGIPGGITNISIQGTSITVTTPPASAPGPVEVTIDTCDSTLVAGTFTYFVSPPIITGFAPITGPVSGGTTVIITGFNLTCIQDVLFGGKPGGIINISPLGTSITVTTPAASAPGPVEVTVNTCEASLAIGTFIYQQGISTLVCPPRDVDGKQTKTKHGSVNVITWKAPITQCGAELPSAYRIYRDAELTELLGTVTACTGQKHFKFKDTDPNRERTTYFVVSVDHFGNQSLPVKVTVKPKERHSSNHSGHNSHNSHSGRGCRSE